MKIYFFTFFCSLSIWLHGAEKLLEGKLQLQGVWGHFVYNESGGVDWEDTGPNDDKEWSWMLNRHLYFSELIGAYKNTGDLKYIEMLRSHLGDWIEANPFKSQISFSAAWRPLEAARRMLGSWNEVLLLMDSEKIFSKKEEDKVLGSLIDHGKCLRQHHSFFGNHLLTEMTALLKLSIRLSDYEESSDWIEYAVEKGSTELLNQTYQEGSYKELSNHYQKVVLLNGQKFLALLEDVDGHDEWKIQVEKRIQAMWRYFLMVSRPSGHGPLNNDSDLEDNLSIIKEHWKTQPFSSDSLESDYRKKALPLNYYFKKAGHVVMRSAWESNCDWAFFDIGPNGTDHQHLDRLHLSLSLKGHDLLVDSGRYQYKKDRFRPYFTGWRGHNSIMIDGHGSKAVADETINREWGMFIDGDLRATASAQSRYANGSVHERTIEYDKVNRLFAITDNLQLTKPSEVEVFWHFHPDWELVGESVAQYKEQQKDQIILRHKKQNILIEILYHKNGENTFIQGQEWPTVMGWYSSDYNLKEPSLTWKYFQRESGMSQQKYIIQTISE